MKPILPGSRLGIMGNGQLGRMFCQSATKMGYEVHCYGPEKNSPTEKAGGISHIGSYQDIFALTGFLESIDALTFEFENIPSGSLDHIQDFMNSHTLVCSPAPNAIRIAQDRWEEKDFFRKIGLPTAQVVKIPAEKSLNIDQEKINFPGVIKTRNFGYDGKGQQKVSDRNDLELAIQGLKSDAIYEEWVQFQKEISVTGVRFEDGTILSYPPSENIHKNHVLDMTIHPARISKRLSDLAVEYFKNLIEELNYIGVLSLELFVLQDSLLCNEFAPRPHNSGHFSMDAANVSQFDLQIRSLCNLPFLEKIVTERAVMKNILGDFSKKKESIWLNYLTSCDYHLHLYQKDEARDGRKMGHWNYIGEELYPFSLED